AAVAARSKTPKEELKEQKTLSKKPIAKEKVIEKKKKALPVSAGKVSKKAAPPVKAPKAKPESRKAASSIKAKAQAAASKTDTSPAKAPTAITRTAATPPQKEAAPAAVKKGKQAPSVKSKAEPSTPAAAPAKTKTAPRKKKEAAEAPAQKSKVKAAPVAEALQSGKEKASKKKSAAKAPAENQEKAAKDATAAKAPAAPKTPAVAQGDSPVEELSAFLQEKVRELVKRYKEDDFLSYSDVEEILPDATADDLDRVFLELRKLDIELEKDTELNAKESGDDSDDDKAKTDQDILDDPVRMYLKQMGQVPLLDRDQEVEISKRIETAENQVKDIIYNMGFAGKEHVALAEKLIAETPRERFDRVVQLQEKLQDKNTALVNRPGMESEDESTFELVQDQKAESRDTYARALKR
ncbi:MAG: hypothetical protein EOM51_11910, partial [Clostridia bacterium]|nr:hypothetical protein [Clostridia bacterium]